LRNTKLVSVNVEKSIKPVYKKDNNLRKLIFLEILVLFVLVIEISEVAIFKVSDIRIGLSFFLSNLFLLL